MPATSDRMTHDLPGWLSRILIVGTIATVALFEMQRPLRRSRQSKARRDARNFAMSVMTAGTIALTEKPLTTRLTLAVHKNRWGLLKMLRLPAALDLLLSVVLLDYTLFIWHYLTHKQPLLWRFHQVHHVDLDLDASTALRFHAGEMLLSVPWRAAQVLLLGISPLGLSLWQTLTLMEIIFHHSNIRLPYFLESRLCKIIVTPRMHGIHHSIVRDETDSNWSTIFTWPDRVHGTIRLNVPQQEITIGVPAYQKPSELTLGKLVAMPVTAQRPSWRKDGETQQDTLSLPKTVLAP